MVSLFGVRVDSWRAVILAGGNGTRMRSEIPKMLQPICGREMVGLVSDAVIGAGFEDVVVVVPLNSSGFGDLAIGKVTLIEQSTPSGTAHAVSQVHNLMEHYHGDLLVINGDVPLITSNTITALMAHHRTSEANVTLLTCSGFPSKGMGRVLREEAGSITTIVEEAELDRNTIMSSEGNVGVYCLKSPWLWEALTELLPSQSGEIYLTDLVASAVKQGYSVDSLALEDTMEGLGVNDGIQLAKAREIMQRRVNEKWLLTGVNIMEPAFIDVTVELGPDTTVYPNTFLRGRTLIGKKCQIGPGSIIDNSVIADGCRVLLSVIEEAVLDEDVDIGPYSHIRAESHVEKNVHIGNFAEIKKSRLGSGTKLGHFSYLGDAWVGSNVNIGAGTVTCNFDGLDKHETIIEDDAFIGSDSMLVAPVRIGARASTGAGSVVTKDVPADTKVVGIPARIVSSEISQKGSK